MALFDACSYFSRKKYEHASKRARGRFYCHCVLIISLLLLSLDTTDSSDSSDSFEVG